MKRRMIFILFLLAALVSFTMYIIGWDHGFNAYRDAAEKAKADCMTEPRAWAEEAKPVTQEIEPVFLACEIEYIPDVDVKEEPEQAETSAAAENSARYTDDDVYCMACVIYQEAGADWICDSCRYRVADVVLNRVADDRFPDTIRGVLEEYMQYGMFWDTGVCFPEKASTEAEQEAVRRAWGVAYDVLNGKHSELYDEGYVWQSEYVQSEDNFCCCGINYGR